MSMSTLAVQHGWKSMRTHFAATFYPRVRTCVNWKVNQKCIEIKCILDCFRSWFESYSEPDYARSSNSASQTVIVEEGPLKAFSHAMEPQLRQLGLPVTLQKGEIYLTVLQLDMQSSEQYSPLLYLPAYVSQSLINHWSVTKGFSTIENHE